MKEIQIENNSLQKLRNKYIYMLEDSTNSTEYAREHAEDLFALDLTMYSRNNSFESIIYNAFAKSVLDGNISLHPEQLRVIDHIEKHNATIVSAPTSFGKTFCIFEYIARNVPGNIVLIVPTLALVDEYFKKIIKTYRHIFSTYKVYTNISEDDEFNFSEKNIFILTHDRIVNESLYSKLKQIDFLVIDEVYKLQTDYNDDRVLVLNMAYYYLSRIAKKYTLLAPFIGGVQNLEKLDKIPVFLKSEYSPVVNEIKTIEILRDKDRNIECKELLKELNTQEKTLIYFPTVKGIYNYINEIIITESELEDIPQYVRNFIKWAEEEIHEEWSVIKALKHGYVIHNGQIPLGTRIFQLDLYENLDVYNRMLCTSTLLEGVNTSAKNIIITKPSRKSQNVGDEFTSFDFFNLVGRTGRLFKHYVGVAYYLKSPTDPIFSKEEAIKDIRFEIVDTSKDVDIQKKEISKHKDVIRFLQELNISLDDYLENIGSKLRFDTVLGLYQNYKKYKNELIIELKELCNNNQRGRRYLVAILYKIYEYKSFDLRRNKYHDSLYISFINSFLFKTRPSIRKVIEDVRVHYSKYTIDDLISNAVKIKNSYLEHTFYVKTLIILFFMRKQNCLSCCIEKLEEKITHPIEYIYFLNSKQKKMLLDLGIYERDIDKILKIIGNKFEDSFELKELLLKNTNKLRNLSYISNYIIMKLN